MKLYRVATLEPAVMPGTITPASLFDPLHRPEHKGMELQETERGIVVSRGSYAELIPWGNVRVASYRRDEPKGGSDGKAR